MNLLRNNETMKTLTGHITATERKAIKAILAAGETFAKVGRKTYKISAADSIYTVTVYEKGRGLVPVPGSPIRLMKYTSTFAV